MRRDGELSLRSDGGVGKGMVASRETSRCEAHFVEVCLTNEPRDAHNLMRRFCARRFEPRVH